jgi:hypothetical protein
MESSIKVFGFDFCGSDGWWDGVCPANDVSEIAIFTDYGHPLNNQYRTPEGLGCALLLSMTGLERSIVADNYDKPIFHISPGRKLPS